VRVLILGGTGEARALAAALHARPDVDVVSSLAGRVRDPALPVGEVRIGGFGGAAGLIGFLRTEGIDAVVDATHPFAATITEHAVAATAHLALPLALLRRPAWSERPNWTRTPDIAAAAAAAAAFPVTSGRVFLTTGRRDLAAFASDERHEYLVRTVDPPHEKAMPLHSLLILDRGPYTVAGEAALMARYDVRLLVTKDSGGPMTSAKLAAAEQLAVPVVVVDRPPPPRGALVIEDVDAAISWLGSAVA